MKKIKIVDVINDTTDEQLTKIAKWFVSFKDNEKAEDITADKSILHHELDNLIADCKTEEVKDDK